MPHSKDLNRLHVFREVALAGSFSKAAVILKQPKSRVSRNISQLERDLGVQLIYRTTRQFQLTPSGKDLLQKTAPLLSELQNTLEQITTEADEISGPVTVTVPEDIGTELMGKICHDFLTLYPKVQLNLVQTNQFLDLVKETVDVAIRIGAGRSSTMIQRRVGTVDMVLVMSPALLSHQAPLHQLTDLERFPFLAFTPLIRQRPHLKLSKGRESQTLKFKAHFSSNNFFPLRQMAVLGGGVALLPAFLVRDQINSGQLVQVFKEWSVEGSPINILIPHQKEPPLRLRRLMDFLSLRLAAYL